MKRAPLLTILIVILSLFVVFIALKRVHKKTQVTSNSASSLGLTFVEDIPLSGGANRLDYQSIDPEKHLLFITHLGSNMVHVYDITEQKIVKAIPNIPSPHGILAVPPLKSVYVSASGQNKVAVIDEDSLAVTKWIDTGDTPDGIAFDPNTSKMYVSNENGGSVTVIDGKTNTRIKDIQIGSSIGNSQYNPVSKHIYTADGGENKLVEIDPVNDQIVNKFDLPNCSHPHGFYIDPSTDYALVTCDSNNIMDVFDLNDKRVISTLTTGDAPDVLAFDNNLHRLYVSAESGVLTLFIVEKDNVKKLAQGFIASKAHTVAVNQENHQVFLPLENVNGKPVLRIFAPSN